MMNRLLKSILAVGAMTGAGLAATLAADAQRMGAQQWAADAGTLVHKASTVGCNGCPWRVRPKRGGNCAPACRPPGDCETGSRYYGRRCECPSGTSWNDMYEYCKGTAQPPHRATPPAHVPTPPRPYVQPRPNYPPPP